jgi:DNA topoisomerase-6 subunit B
MDAGLRKEYDAEFYSTTTRDAGVHSGHPFIVEAGLAYGGSIESEGQIDLLRFANRVPLVYQPGACGVTTTIKSINWQNYISGNTGMTQSGGSGIPTGPAVLMVHVASTNVPFTSESKDALASVPDIEYEVEQAVRECARDLKKYLKKQRSLKKRKRKQNVIAEILPLMATKLAETADAETPSYDGSLAKVMNNMLVRRAADGDDVTVAIRNHTSGQKTFTVVDLVDAEPTTDDEDVEISEVSDGEWAVRWRGPVRKGGSAEFTYSVDADASSDLAFEDIEDEKLTVIA